MRDFDEIFGVEAAEDQVVDWAAVEERIGTSLPGDYREFAETYPAIHFGSLITIFHPNSVNVVANLIEYGGRIRETWLGIEQQVGGLPYSIFPGEGGLLPWGVDDDGAFYFWLTNGVPDEWSVVVCESLEWWEYKGGFRRFWSDLSQGEISSPVIPVGFPGKNYAVRKVRQQS